MADSLNCLAKLHYLRGRYAKAEPLLRRALEMNERLYQRDRFPQGERAHW